LRVHNSAVTAMVQMKEMSSPSSVRKILFGAGGASDYQITVSNSVNLLVAFGIEGFFVGVDKRTKQVRQLGPRSPDCDGYATMGDFYVSIGPEDLRTIVNYYKGTSHAIFSAYVGILGCAWRASGKIISVRHVFADSEDEDSVVSLHPEAKTVLYEDVDRDVVIFESIEWGVPMFDTGICIALDDVLIFAHDVLTGTFQVLGTFKLLGDDDMWFINAVLDYGYSGALVYSPQTQCVVGLYVGLYMEDNDRKYGRITPIHDVWHQV